MSCLLRQRPGADRRTYDGHGPGKDFGDAVAECI